MSSTAAKELLEKIAQDLSQDEVVFPTCFHITLKVRDMLRDPDLSIDKLANTLRAEPMISARILKVANSAAMRPGGGPELRDLKQAIMQVGLEVVKSVAFAVAMEQLVRSKRMVQYTDLSKKIWEHSILVAAIAKQLARVSRRVKADQAFFAGLVHDIGAFYLLFCASEDPVLSQSREDVVDLMVGWHDGISYALLDALGLQAEDLLQAIQDHEADYHILEFKTLGDVLCAANRLANTRLPWHDQPTDRPEHYYLLPIAPEELAEVMEQSQVDVGELRATLMGG